MTWASNNHTSAKLAQTFSSRPLGFGVTCSIMIKAKTVCHKMLHEVPTSEAVFTMQLNMFKESFYCILS